MERVTVFSLASRSTDGNSGAIVNSAWRGVRLFLYISENSGGNLISWYVENNDPLVPGNWIALPAAFQTSIGGTGENVLVIHPNAADVSFQQVRTHLGRSWRIRYTLASQGVPMTFSVFGQYLR